MPAEAFDTWGNPSVEQAAAIFSDRRLDNVQIIRDTFGIPYDNKERTTKALKRHELWHLFQKRNLIVRRRGVVESKYLAKTGDTSAVGTVIKLGHEDIMASARAIRDIGLALVNRANAKAPTHGEGDHPVESPDTLRMVP